MSNLLTTNQLCLRWSLKEGTLRKWRSTGIGPKFLKLGKGKTSKVLYREKEIIKFEKTWERKK